MANNYEQQENAKKKETTTKSNKKPKPSSQVNMIINTAGLGYHQYVLRWSVICGRRSLGMSFLLLLIHTYTEHWQIVEFKTMARL